jgi:hypothetical protein
MFEGGATQPARMHRPSNAARLSPRAVKRVALGMFVGAFGGRGFGSRSSASAAMRELALIDKPAAEGPDACSPWRRTGLAASGPGHPRRLARRLGKSGTSKTESRAVSGPADIRIPAQSRSAGRHLLLQVVTSRTRVRIGAPEAFFLNSRVYM